MVLVVIAAQDTTLALLTSHLKIQCETPD